MTTETREIYKETHWGVIYKQNPNAVGYKENEVLLGGKHPIQRACCRCETASPLDCGCGFGQCANGLIF